MDYHHETENDQSENAWHRQASDDRVREHSAKLFYAYAALREAQLRLQRAQQEFNCEEVELKSHVADAVANGFIPKDDTYLVRDNEACTAINIDTDGIITVMPIQETN